MKGDLFELAFFLKELLCHFLDIGHRGAGVKLLVDIHRLADDDLQAAKAWFMRADIDGDDRHLGAHRHQHHTALELSHLARAVVDMAFGEDRHDLAACQVVVNRFHGLKTCILDVDGDAQNVL